MVLSQDFILIRARHLINTQVFSARTMEQSYQTIEVQKLYTYPCAGTGGHTEYARIWNETLDVNATWNGYKEDWHNITFDEPFMLVAGEEYNYCIRTGSYPQIHHTDALLTANGWLNCTLFTDTNGKKHDNWVPAIKLFLQ